LGTVVENVGSDHDLPEDKNGLSARPAVRFG
jgi:hypothetical protein